MYNVKTSRKKIYYVLHETVHGFQATKHSLLANTRQWRLKETIEIEACYVKIICINACSQAKGLKLVDTAIP